MTKTVDEGGGKKRKWSKEATRAYSAKRRERYKNDPEYREQVKAAARESYERNKNPGLKGYVDALERNIENARSFGEKRPIFVGLANVGEELCFSEEDMARMLDRHPQSFRRMVNDGRWPEPIFSTRFGRTKAGVYLIDEAVAMARVFLEHSRVVMHYYTSHKDTVAAIHAAAKTERNKTELGQWAMQQSTSE